MFNPKEIVDRVMAIVSIIPAAKDIYVDLRADGDLDSLEALKKISEFIAGLSNKYAEYASHEEVAMFVCGILGLMHVGDSSGMYVKLLEFEANKAEQE